MRALLDVVLVLAPMLALAIGIAAELVRQAGRRRG